MRIGDRLVGKIEGQLFDILNKLRDLEEREFQIRSEMRRLRPISGTLERKIVRNKVGKEYCYWYLRKWENGKLKSEFLGKKVPSIILKGIEDRKKLKELQKELREIQKKREKIIKTLMRISKALSELLVITI